MPRYRVKGPDGQSFIVNAPEGATQEQVMAYAQKMGPKAKAPEKPRNAGTGIPFFDRAVSSANEALIGGVEGLYNVGSAIGDPIVHTAARMLKGKEYADSLMSQTQRSRGQISDAVSRKVVSDPNPVARVAGRIGGSMLIPVPKIPGAGKIIAGANRAVQGAIGGVGSRDVDQGAGEAAAIGAGANVVLPPALAALARTKPAQAVGRGIGQLAAPVISKLDDASEAIFSRVAPKLGIPYKPLSPNAPMLPSPSNPLEPLGRKAMARAARFKSVGIDNPTTGMVTRNPQAFSFEQNIGKVQSVGDDLGAQIRNVETSLVKKGQELVRSQGASRAGPEATGKGVQDALDSKRTELQEVTSKLYTQVRETRGDEVVGTLGGLRDNLRHPDMVDNAVLDGMRTSVMRRMERLGLVDDVGSAVEGKVTTIGQAEELRKFIGGLGDGRDPLVRMARGRLIDALDDDVVAAVGDDAFKTARASARARFEEFGKSFAGKIADEGIAPERLTKRVLSETTSLKDLRSLRKSLQTGTPEQIERGQEAWKGLRGQALDDLFAASSDDEGKLLGGKLARDFYKQSAKFRELLDPADFKTLTRLVQASRDATVAPPMSSVNYSGTAVTGANMFQAMKPANRESWLKLLAKNGAEHAAAFAMGGPPANIGLAVGKGVASAGAAATAQQRAAAELEKRVQLARSPEEFAAAIKALEDAARSNVAAREMLDRAGRAFGGAAVAQAQ